MKFIYYTNNIVFALTILGYSLLFPGLFMQIILGILQVLFFIVLLLNYEKFSTKIKEYLLIYGTLTMAFLLLFFLGESFMESLNTLGYVIFNILMPLGIAGYFTYIVAELKKCVL
ncbi:hypothetical protein EZY14_006460 [Kordia sp. TARA_039_SRF]|nr:hypothetical protein EZY14_006460 [Kordia sp. TARA_039_SRF]